MADEQKPTILQAGPAEQLQKGVQIRTMKSDIEALQKKPGTLTPALKPAISPLTGGLPPAICIVPKLSVLPSPAGGIPKPPVVPAVPPIIPSKPLPADLFAKAKAAAEALAKAGAVPAPLAVPSPAVPAPVIPPAVKPALPPIAPVSVSRPAAPPAVGIPSFRPVAPPIPAVPPAGGPPRPPIVPTSSLAGGLPAEIPAEEGGRERIMFLAKRIALFGGLAVIVGGILGIVIYYLVPPAAPLAPKTPAALFSVDDIKIIDLGQEPEKVLMEEIRALGAEPLGSEKSFTQILFKIATQKCFTLKRNCVVESRYLEPEEIYDILGAAVPPYLSGLDNNDFTLFVYNQEGSPRFGAVILASDAEAAFADISAEESGLAGYWELLTGAAFPSPEGYKDSVYQNINIRYLNLPDPYLAVDYASYPARDYLLFATSRESIFALVDKLFAMEGK